MLVMLIGMHIYEDVCAFLSRRGVLQFKIVLLDFGLLNLVYDERWSQVLLSGRVFFDRHVTLMKISELTLQFVAFDSFHGACELARVKRDVFKIICLVEVLGSLIVDFVVNCRGQYR